MVIRLQVMSERFRHVFAYLRGEEDYSYRQASDRPGWSGFVAWSLVFALGVFVLVSCLLSNKNGTGYGAVIGATTAALSAVELVRLGWAKRAHGRLADIKQPTRFIS